MVEFLYEVRIAVQYKVTHRASGREKFDVMAP